MSNKADIRQYMDFLKEERNAVTLYDKLADAEPSAELASLYRRLADTERKHAGVWEEKLRSLGVSIPEHRPDWRTRVLGWMANRFGNSFVLPTLAEIEKGAGSDYNGQAEAEAANMPAEERSHARVFSFLSKNTRGIEGSAVARLEGRHRSAGGNALRAGVLGANDGLVSVLSLVMGVAGAGLSSHSILISGMAGLLAGAISMALGEWLSVQSSRELHERQMDIEKKELEESPEEEKAEMALIYQAKGLAPDEAKRLAERLISDPASALDTLSREELGIDPKELGGSAWEAAITSFILFAIGAIIPVLPFFFTGGIAGVAWSLGSSIVGLFVIGAGITLITGKGLWFSGMRQILFGMAAAAVTFGIGKLWGGGLAP